MQPSEIPSAVKAYPAQGFTQVAEVELAAAAQLLGPNAAVWMALRRHGAGGSPAWPSNKTLARITGLTMDSVKKALARLIRSGAVQRLPDNMDGCAVYTTVLTGAFPAGPGTFPDDSGTFPGGTFPAEVGTFPHPGRDVSGPNEGRFRPGEERRKREGREKEEKTDVPDNVRLVFETWIKATKRTGKTHLDAKRRRLIQAAIKSHGLEITLDAVVGVTLVEWNAGKNDSGKVYDDLELVLRNAKNIERFSKAAHAAPTPDVQAITAAAEALDAERYAHQEHFVRTFHAQHKMQDAVAVPLEWEGGLLADWGPNFPRRFIEHLGRPVFVFGPEALHFHCVMLAALAYTRQLTEQKYTGDDDISVCERRAAATAEVHQRIALKEQMAMVFKGSAS